MDDEQRKAADLNREAQAIWEDNAAFWDSAMGEGNAFQLQLIAPAAERLLALTPGELVLDVACGNGVFARRLAQLGAQVVACDFSQNFIERARERGTEYAARIEYAVVDATSREQLLGLRNGPGGTGAAGERRFDAVYCGMAMQDMTEIEPLFSAVSQLLRPGGRFVFAIPHPAFNNSYIRKVVEEEDVEGGLVEHRAIKITGYIQPRTDLGLGIVGQPAPHYYFHRPLSAIFNTAFACGLVLDGMEEPVFDPATAQPSRPFSWQNYPSIPPVLVSRLRRP